MFPRKQQHKKGRQGPKSTGGMTVTLLKQISDYQSTQTAGLAPADPDIPIEHLKRNKVHTFLRTTFPGQVIASTTLDVFGALSFQLSSVVNSTEFTTLFDQYRISYVEVVFIPISAVASVAPLVSVIDYDDASVPSAVSDLWQYSTACYTAAGHTHIRRLHPRFDFAAYSGAFTSYALAPYGTWVDVASPSVQYYGVKWALSATTGGTATAVYNIQVNYHIQCRNTR